MEYFISFLEGIITFISPCLLPMLPVYVSYFAGGGERKSTRTLKCAAGFVLGFTAVFMAMGALAGSLGGLLRRYQQIVNLVSGFVVVIFGLKFLGVLRIRLFRGMRKEVDTDQLSFFSAALFGVIFSLGWTPCVGVFLGSALMLASQRGHVMTGLLMLLCYSAGLGIPFILSALLIDRLKSTFAWIRKNYKVINLVCGSFLVLIGIAMATGWMGRLLAIVS